MSMTLVSAFTLLLLFIRRSRLSNAALALLVQLSMALLHVSRRSRIITSYFASFHQGLLRSTSEFHQPVAVFFWWKQLPRVSRDWLQYSLTPENHSCRFLEASWKSYVARNGALKLVHSAVSSAYGANDVPSIFIISLVNSKYSCGTPVSIRHSENRTSPSLVE